MSECKSKYVNGELIFYEKAIAFQAGLNVGVSGNSIATGIDFKDVLTSESMKFADDGTINNDTSTSFGSQSGFITIKIGTVTRKILTYATS